jgi:hypothetical protein
MPLDSAAPIAATGPLAGVICVLGLVAVAGWVAWRFGPTLARITGWCSWWVAWACGSQSGYGYCVAFLVLGAVAWGGGTLWYARRRGPRCSQLTQRLAGLPEPRRRLGRGQDPYAIERAGLTSALQANARELDSVLTQRNGLERELGDPAEARAEREGLEYAITQTTQEHTALRNELAERELDTPTAWVKATFGKRPDRPAQREAWENGVRHAARYRAEHAITDPADPLGPRPTQREQLRDWERARAAIERAGRRLGRDVGTERDTGLGIGL